MIRKRGRRVPPSSTLKIRLLANKFREVFAELGAPRSGRVDIIDILDCALPGILPDFVLDVVPDSELGEDHAQTFPDRLLIKVKESVYEGARKGLGRDIFTLAHELGHLFLHRNISSYARSNTSTNHKLFEDSEWQADCFAAEFLMPYEEVMMCRSVEEVMKRFGVSHKAAEVRFGKIKK
ncbi:ImmA/IrrE family metallo-endopeptidase [Rheinheimera sp.]|uniref:ImmA/IrrE family metallo-endopeptidase n=1 Tax=Rheinheimera sp. TaxID=1869214 RepID=UPI00307D686C